MACRCEGGARFLGVEMTVPKSCGNRASRGTEKNLMRQLTFIAPGRFEWHDVPRPQLSAPADALVRPLAVARCDLDLYIATGAAARFKGPFAIGHEAVGVVTEAGEAAGVVPGDRVVVPFQLSCGRCDNCRRGLTNTCSAYPPRAAFGLKPSCGTEFGGAISELMRVPFADHMLVKVPDSVDAIEIASVADNISDGWRAVAPLLKARPGASVLVVGGLGQSISLYAAGLAASLGAGKVLYLDDNAERRAIAQRMGALAEPLALADRTPAADQFEITVDGSGDSQALRFAIASTQCNGTITIISMYEGVPVQLPLGLMYAKGITLITGRVQARTEIPDVLAHCMHKHFHPSAVTSRVVPFSNAPDGFLDPGPKIVFTNDLS